jgi:hypothetical protein
MGWIVFILFFIIISALLAYVVHIDYNLDNIPDHPRTEAEANVDLMKLRIRHAKNR